MQTVTLDDPSVLAPAVTTVGGRATACGRPARRRLTLGLVMTITLVAFEALAISTVMPVVADDLGGLGLYGWVFSGFFLGNLLGIVIAGQAADRRGTALPFLVGLVLFTAGLCLGGLAPTMGVLVAARVLQGLGAGAIPAVAYATVGRSYPAAHPTARVRGVLHRVGGARASSARRRAAPSSSALSWRAVFLALLPFVVLAGVITIPALTERARAGRRRRRRSRARPARPGRRPHPVGRARSSLAISGPPVVDRGPAPRRGGADRGPDVHRASSRPAPCASRRACRPR